MFNGDNEMLGEIAGSAADTIPRLPNIHHIYVLDFAALKKSARKKNARRAVRAVNLNRYEYYVVYMTNINI